MQVWTRGSVAQRRDSLARIARKKPWSSTHSGGAAASPSPVMAYEVDAQIREMNRRITANQEGEDGGAWLSSKAAQRMSLAEPEIGHCREVISKFGGVIKESTAVAIPKQPWHERKNREYLAISPDSFRSRSPPTHVVVGGGIAGYKGHKPHAPQWSVPQRRADRNSAYLAPYLEAEGISTETYPPQKPQTIDRFAHVDQSKFKKRSDLPPGYAGHVPRVQGNATESFGTSHWRTSKPVTRAHAAAIAKQQAMDLAARSGAGGEADDRYSC
jgi:hypothetical protein